MQEAFRTVAGTWSRLGQCPFSTSVRAAAVAPRRSLQGCHCHAWSESHTQVHFPQFSAASSSPPHLGALRPAHGLFLALGARW